MPSKVNYTLVGFFVVIFAAVSILLFFWLHYKGGRTVYHTYVMYVHDDVTGLSVQSPVRYTGVPVGYVDKITLDVNNPQLVRIRLKIKQGAPILTSTVATLSVQGITGAAYVALEATTDDAPLLKAKPDQAFPVIRSRPSLLNTITNALPEVAENLQDLSSRISHVLDAKNLDALSDILQNFKRFSDSLSQTSPDWSNIMNATNATMKNIAESSQQLPELINQTNKTIEGINNAMTAIQNATYGLDKLLGTANVLVANTTQQLLPSTSSLINRLNHLSLSLQSLTSELARNPSVLIRGRQPAQPGPGETR